MLGLHDVGATLNPFCFSHQWSLLPECRRKGYKEFAAIVHRELIGAKVGAPQKSPKIKIGLVVVLTQPAAGVGHREHRSGLCALVCGLVRLRQDGS